MSNDNRSFKSKFTNLVVITILGVFVIGQIVNITLKYNSANRTLEERIENLVGTLTISLTEAMWDYDEDQISAVCDSIFISDEVNSLVVSDSIKGVVYERKNTVTNESIKLFQINQNVIKKEKNIGSFTLEYTNALLLKRLLLEVVQEAVIIVFVILVVLYVITKTIKRLTDPLQKLETIAINITDNLDESIELHANSLEINSLIKSFTKMKSKIKQYNKELEALNLSLEDKVSIRTNELNESNIKLRDTIHKLEKAKEELEIVSKIKLTSKLVSRIAHEINTPLGNAVTITSYIEKQFVGLKEMLTTQNTDNPKFDFDNASSIDNSLIKLANSLKEAVRLINQFKALNVSMYMRDYKLTNLKDLIYHSIEMIQSNYDAPLSIDVKCSEDILIKTRPVLIVEILKQLIDNTVIHAFQNMQEIRILIKCKEDIDTITLDYIDYGKGIDDGFIDTVFMPFSKEKRMSPGVGLGLAIVENLVVIGLKGTITCSSSKNNETLFSITFYKETQKNQ